MYFKKIFVNKIGMLSYIFGCAKAKVACVINPKDDIREYVELINRYNFKLSHIFETSGHIHKYSGKLELKYLTNAEIIYLDELDNFFWYKLARVGDEHIFGDVKLTVIFSPKHISYANSIIVSDMSDNKAPWLIPTRESLFIGNFEDQDLPGNELGRKISEFLNFPDPEECYWPVNGMTDVKSIRHDKINRTVSPL